MKKYIWGEDPDFYGPQMYYRTSLMLGKLKKYFRHGSILDAGCGDGVLSLRLARDRFQVVAGDSSQKCITHLSRKIKKMGIARKITAKIMDLTKLSHRRDTFDAVTCGEVLEHIAEDKKVIKEFFRVLKKGGICVVTTPGKPELWHEIDDISGHVRRYTKQEIEQKFISAGFVVRECVYWGFPINMLWHRLVFKPYILKKLRNGTNITAENSVSAQVVKSNLLQRVASHVFGVDNLFNWTGFGEFLYLVAQKPN